MRRVVCFVALALAGFAWAGEQDHPLKKAEVGDWVVFESNMGWGLPVTQKKILAAREGDKAVLVGETRGKQSGDLHARWKETVNLDEDFDLVTMLTPGKIKGVRKIAEGKETIAVMGKNYPSEWIAFAFVVEDEDNAAGEAKFWFATGQMLGFAKAEISVPFNGETVKIGYLAVETGKGEAVPDLADIWDTSAEDDGDDWDEEAAGAVPPQPAVPEKIESVTLDLGGGVAMTLNRIPAGRFMMGSPVTERGHDTIERQREVTVSKAYYMGVYPVTQAQYQAVMGNNPSEYPGPDKPVETVSWDEAVAFCVKLSEMTGRKARLPTEAEWELACRAGTTTAYSTGDTLTPEQANFNKSGHYQTSSVGIYPANAFGLFDMHGNVGEWCSDWYWAHPEDTVDPKGPAQGRLRVFRSGSWFTDVEALRSAWRGRHAPDFRGRGVGFRVAMDE